ncbi:hypothetical protein NSB1T_09475 [Coprobacter fastidiosus NSB1 = JCM 33896]|nr:hypothetical protein NSB1T_09475 [Coprobacter fastidiosus NSB1 = JCM 33896]
MEVCFLVAGFEVCAETKPKGITVNKPVIINCFNPINFIPMIFCLTFPDFPEHG